MDAEKKLAIVLCTECGAPVWSDMPVLLCEDCFERKYDDAGFDFAPGLDDFDAEEEA